MEEENIEMIMKTHEENCCGVCDINFKPECSQCGGTDDCFQ